MKIAKKIMNEIDGDYLVAEALGLAVEFAADDRDMTIAEAQAVESVNWIHSIGTDAADRLYGYAAKIERVAKLLAENPEAYKNLNLS